MSLARKHVLVVDDNRAHRDIVAFNLMRLGFDVTTAESGKIALQFAEQSEVDLVITDYVMPGLTGADLVRELRSNERYAVTPIILLTGATGQLPLVRLRDEFSVFPLPKPYPVQRLVDTVCKCLSLAAGED